MKLSTVALAALATAAYAKNIISLDFDVTRGDSFKDSSKHKRASLIKRDNADGTVDVTLTNESNFYSVSIMIGSDQQNVTVLVDTGSSDLWITENINPYCMSSSTNTRRYRNLDAPKASEFLFNDNSNDNDSNDSNSNDNQNTNNQDKLARRATGSSSGSGYSPSDTSYGSYATIDCSEYGTFDPSSSTTFTSNNTEFFIVYGDNSYAYGTWGYDSIQLQGVEVKDFSFAVANQTNSTVGVLGIGFTGLETTYSGVSSSNSDPYTYANLPVKLVQDGLINKNAYSLFLNSLNADSGSLLFGGVDHAKYNGTLATVPIINTLASKGYDSPIKIQVTLSGFGIKSGSKETTIDTNKYPALLDSGTTLTYLPDSLIETIASEVGATYSSTLGYYTMSCSDSYDYDLVYNFQGKLISVPLSNVMLQVSSYSSKCVLGLVSSGEDTAILGDSFLQYAYVVYDLDNEEVSLAEVNFTSDEDIEEIVSDVPSATRAPEYSSSWSSGQSYSTSVNGNIFTYSDADAPAASGSITRSASSGLNATSVTGFISSRTATGTATGTATSSSARSSKTSTGSTAKKNDSSALNLNVSLLLALGCLFM